MVLKVNLNVCLFVLDSEKNENIRKNDIQKLKVLVNKKLQLPSVEYNSSDIKEQIRDYLSHIINTNIFHLEQVYTMGYKDRVDVIYLSISNMENIKKLSSDFELIEFNIKKNDSIILGDSVCNYKTIEKENYNSIEYFHEFEGCNENLNATLMYLLICFKRVISNINNTDILFKFMGSSFTLEDVRILYEMISGKTADKSNFRKKIIKYCEKVESEINYKSGFRPSQRYRFKPLKGDVWV